MQGRGSSAVRDFALYGETTGETDEFGLPVRLNWAADYRGKAAVVYGHTPVPQPEWLNNTINIDTGCVFGGRLTALRYPERELVSIPAEQQWYEPVQRLAPTTVDREASVLKIGDVMGGRWLESTHAGKVKIPEDNAAAALEVMSRFAVDPRWLIYLPPTMSPVATSKTDGFLEHPEQAFDEYAGWGVTRVVCEEKHMGSRAIAVINKADAARQQAAVSERLRAELERAAADYHFALERKYAWPPIVRVLDTVTRALPDDTWLTQLEIRTLPKGRERDREIVMRGESANAGRLIPVLEETGIVAQVAPRSPTTKIQPGPGEIFDLGAQLKPLPRPAMVALVGPDAPPPKPAVSIACTMLTTRQRC